MSLYLVDNVGMSMSLTDDDSRYIANGNVPPSAIMAAMVEEMPVVYFFCDDATALFVAENDKTALTFAVVFDAFCINKFSVTSSFIVKSEERGLFALVSIEGTLPSSYAVTANDSNNALCHRICRKVEGDRCRLL